MFTNKFDVVVLMIDDDGDNITLMIDANELYQRAACMYTCITTI